MTKATKKKNPKSKVTTQKLHKNFDYTTIADRLRTVSWSNNSHQTGVVKPVDGIPTFPLTAHVCNKKDTHLKIKNTIPSTRVSIDAKYEFSINARS